MKSLLLILFCGLCTLSFGQETPIQFIKIELEQLGAPLLVKQESLGSEKYQLMPIDLSVDLRKQALSKNAPTLELPKEQFIAPLYSVAVPQPQALRFTVSGNGNSSSFTNNGGIKNIAYKDAGFYSGAFCPITGLAY